MLVLTLAEKLWKQHNIAQQSSIFIWGSHNVMENQ